MLGYTPPKWKIILNTKRGSLEEAGMSQTQIQYPHPWGDGEWGFLKCTDKLFVIGDVYDIKWGERMNEWYLGSDYSHGIFFNL